MTSCERVRLNVGGKIFETTRSTLEASGPDSLLSALVDPSLSLECNDHGIPEFFLDRDPKVFRVLLNLLRTSTLDLPSSISTSALLKEADFFGVMGQVKEAMHPKQLDANELEKVAVLRPNVGPADVCTAMAASSDGSLAVAHGNRVTLYDWMLQRSCTIISDMAQVDSLSLVSNHHVAAGGVKSGDLALYDCRDGEKLHSLSCLGTHAAIRSIVASDSHIFAAALRKTVGQDWEIPKSVAMVDKTTMQLMGSSGSALLSTCRLGGPNKLQWLPLMRLLLVARRFSGGVCGSSEDASYCRLWDPRSNRIVWDWQEFEDAQTSLLPSDRWCALSDVAVSEEQSLLLKLCPLLEGDESSTGLAAMDLRKLPRKGGVTKSREPTIGQEDWELLQWRSGASLRVGRTHNDKSVPHVLCMVTIPGTGQIITNRQPTLEVFTRAGSLHVANIERELGLVEGEQVPEWKLNPFGFKRTYGQAMEEYFRRKTQSEGTCDCVYDMCVGGNRLFVAREDFRAGGTGLGGVEVWETSHGISSGYVS